MTFNEGMQFDPDRASTGGGGGRGRGIAIGGGAGGLIIVVIALLMGVDPSSILGGSSTGGGDGGAGPDVSQCTTGQAANTDPNCRVIATAYSLDDVWGTELPKQTGVDYIKPGLKLFSGDVQTGCGPANTDVGPFYCPADNVAYFDTTFFKTLEEQFGSSSGALAQEYVVAHEFGHHIQTQLGDINKSQQDPQGANSGAVRTELQADCYGGIWAYYADKDPAPGQTQPYLKPLTQKDIADALSAAASVGDDHIQESMTGRTNPEKYTHGTSAQRQAWFSAGYKTGQISACDTYSARDLNNPPALR
ncbi:neutral zinc metallopeptidase [Smaragdicoccus niigatensis]|uniref:KPN_02809 family neutral zinc metallopeptidase n=1 Tax=Smaragdicoccus niigatensis TaxID=359359 RepID=UPI000376A37D|nr:neutral zinc metallopeptidase [Smaragdicoccus niigatensis]